MSNSSDKVLDGCQGTCVFTFIVAGNTIGQGCKPLFVLFFLLLTYYITNLQCPIMSYMGFL